MHRLAAAALLALSLATGGASLWALSQNPFAEPFTERSVAEARLALDRALAREVTEGWLVPRLDAALEAGDRDRVQMLVGLATDHGVEIPPARRTDVDFALAPQPFSTRAYDCAACAVDIHACATLSQMAACALPFEMTVAGDLNALRRQAQAGIAGREVDQIETGLALVGVGATVAVLVSGGSSYVVKTGATFLRIARRMGAITPAFARVLTDAADLPINWGAVLRGAPIEEITDATKLARLMRIAEDFGTIRANTSTAEALVLMRHVDTAEDAARLARLSTITGKETRAVIEVLGPARAFRALSRVADLTFAAIGLVAAFLAQLGGLLASAIAALLRRRLRPVARRRKPRHDRAV